MSEPISRGSEPAIASTSKLPPDNIEIKADIKPKTKSAPPRKPPNPVWKMLGLPDLPRKLPSRNWLIFWTLTGSLTAAIVYDKRETRRAQRKWAKAVEHLKFEPLDIRMMPRKVTIFLESPPADGLRYAQDHFREYVKPILVASGIDWDFVQGRKEGDVRAEMATRIRQRRLPFDEAADVALTVRHRAGIVEYQGEQGDIVVGRNTWKEYIRGLHEGWLGPLTAPVVAKSEAGSASEEVTTVPSGITLLSEPRDATTEEKKQIEKLGVKPEVKEKPKKTVQLPPFISTTSYQSAALPVECPTELSPSQPVQLPHLLGFLNTGTRFYRFLNRRHLADSIGRDVATIILNAATQPYQSAVGEDYSAFVSDSPPNDSNIAKIQQSEQALALISEERDWHKSVHQPVLAADEKTPLEPQPERTWTEPVVLDARIAARMRRSVLTSEEEARIAAIVVPEEEIEGFIKGGLRTLGREAVKWWWEEGRDARPGVGTWTEVDRVTGESTERADMGFVPGVLAGMRVPNVPQMPSQSQQSGLQR